MNDKRLNEITAKAAGMTAGELANHLFDHTSWYAEYAENAGDEHSEEYWQMMQEAAILSEIANRLKQFEEACKALDKLDGGATK